MTGTARPDAGGVLVGCWWGAWLASSLSSLMVVALTDSPGGSGLDRALTTLGADTVDASVSVAAAVLALLVVRRITGWLRG